MLNAIVFYRISRWLYLHRIPFLPKLITLLIFLIYNSKIPYQAHIGKGTKFGYGGMGVVVHSKAVIGDNCSIGQQVTIGGGNNRYPGLPIIGNNVTVGANAVVTKPVPDNAIVAGVPAKILRFKDENGDS